MTSRPDAAELREWALIGGALAGHGMKWPVADWLLWGLSQWGKEHWVYSVAQELTGLSYQALRNGAKVARAFPFARRRAGLTIGHHDAVAHLAEAQQDFVLQFAVECGLTVRELRDSVVRKRDLPAARVPVRVPTPAQAAAEEAEERIRGVKEAIASGRGDQERMTICLNAAEGVLRRLASFEAQEETIRKDSRPDNRGVKLATLTRRITTESALLKEMLRQAEEAS